MAQNDLFLAKDLANQRGRAHYAIHFCHQTLEKGLKAIIAEKTGEIPFPTHNFKSLLGQSRLKKLPEEIELFLLSMAPHYIATKYPEDIADLKKCYTKQKAKQIVEQTTKVMVWFVQQLK